MYILHVLLRGHQPCEAGKKGDSNVLSTVPWFPEECSFYEGTQASPVCFSGKGSTQIRTSVELLWTSDQPVAEAATCATHSKHRDEHPCPQRDLKPQYRQSSGCRPTPYTARLPGSVVHKILNKGFCNMLRLFTENIAVIHRNIFSE
jgi:hypothetical protein